MRRLLLLAVLLSSCGGSNPAAPTVTPTAPSTYTISGAVTSLQSGAALPGVTVNGTPADGSGRYSVTSTGGSLTLQAIGVGIVPRTVTGLVSGSRAFDLTAIALDGTFDLNFYQQFARGKLDNADLQPIQRWEFAHSVYIRTVDDAGNAIDQASLDLVQRTITETAPIWSAGAFGVSGFERGTETREGQSGWLTVKWDNGAAHCGMTTIGNDGGTMTLRPTDQACRCGSVAVGAALVRHELGHAFGYWHTDSTADTMHTPIDCDRQPSARERYHARIVYARPVGNVDPDTDSSSKPSFRVRTID
jgi:hypothetical protein